MLNNKNPVLFKRLQKLNLSRRLEIAGSPEAGSLLSVLTPAQFSDLFPKAYRNPAYMPDVGGFRLAISRKSAEQQSAAAETLEKRLSSVEKTTADISKPWTQRLKEKVFGTGGGQPTMPQLNEQQQSAWNKIQQGNINANSEEGKIFSRLSQDKLSAMGITKTKDKNGVDIFAYAQPEVSREEAKARLRDTGIGSASRKYESGNRGVAMISSGAGDPGGVSYGAHQLASKTGSMAAFLKSPEGSMYAPRFAGTEPGSSSFNQIYKQIVSENPSAFEDAQHAYITRTHYNPVRDFAASKGFDVNDRRVQEALFSMGVQHGKAKDIIAMASSKGNGEDQVKSLFDARRQYVDSIGMSNLKTRYASEEKDILNITSGQKPEGKDGQYTEQQIQDMMEKLKTEKNDTRRSMFAREIYAYEEKNNIPHSAEVKTVLQGGDLSAIPQHSVHAGESYGSGQCVALSQKFAPGIGHAGDWKFKSGSDGIVPGAVIATTNYGNGESGKMAKSFSDHKSRFHTGVVLTHPDASGNVLIYDQWLGKGAGISKVNINDYNGTGTKMAALVGGEPTEQSKRAVELALSNASPAERAAIESSASGKAPDVAAIPIQNNIERGTENSTPTNQQSQDPLNPPAVAPPTATPQAQAEAAALNAPTTPGAPPPTATVEKPPAPIKSQPLRYKFDEQAFVKEVRAKETGAMFVSDEYILNETRKGFADTPGVKYNKGVITIEDPNSPAIQQIMNDMKSHNFEHDKFLSKMAEEKKKEQPKTTATVEPPKPKEQTPAAKPDVLNPPAQVPTAPTPQGQAESKQLNAPTTPPPPQPEPKQVNPTVNPVPGASTGGSFEAPNGATFYPIDKRDDTIAVDSKTQEPLFTAKTGEGVSMNGGNIDVTPQEKMTNTNPAPNPLEAKLNNISSDLRSAFDNISQGQYGDAVRAPRLRETPNEMPNMIEQINNSIAQTVRSPSFGRAMGRVADPHFSYGNKRSES